MHPIFIQIGPITIYSYGVMMAIAFLTALYLVIAETKKQKIPENTVYDCALYLVLGGIIGARIFYVLMNIEFFIANPIEIFMLQRGGLVFYGGALGGLAGGAVYLRVKKLDFFDWADLFAPYVVLAHAIGRIGCYLNGCCYGINDHPVQLYESFYLVVLFLFLRRSGRKKTFNGEVFLSWLMLYSIWRFMIDFIRGDLPRVIEIINIDFTITQLTSVVIFVVASLIFSIKYLEEKDNHRKKKK